MELKYTGSKIIFSLVAAPNVFRDFTLTFGANTLSDNDYAFLSLHPDFQRMIQSGEIILMDLPEETPPETPVKEAKPPTAKPTKDNA